MKKLITAVAVAATMISATAASATDRENGHWEWQAQSNPGPSRPTLPNMRRVWVRDASVGMACCDHMETDAFCPMGEAAARSMGHLHPKH